MNCSACAGDYEDPERTALEAPPEEAEAPDSREAAREEAGVTSDGMKFAGETPARRALAGITAALRVDLAE